VKKRKRPGWLRRHPFAADAVLAVVLLVLALPTAVSEAALEERYRDPNALAFLFAVLQTAPLAWRRRAPVAVLALSSAGLAANTALGFQPTLGLLGPLVAVYTVAAAYPRPPLAVRAIVASVLVVVASPFLHEGRLRPDEFTLALVLFGVPWLVGQRYYRSRAFRAALEERAARAERESALAAQQAIADERARIARELHDVVAHAISVVIVQAGAARRVLKTSPERADEAIGSIQTVGRQALAEMRRLLEVLRRDHELEVLGPQPGVDRLDALVQQVEAAGLRVDVVIEGEARPLPASIDLSVYRIVQEALTNTLKHAGPARARVRLRYAGDRLQVTVSDDGRRGAAGRGNGRRSGHGLLGMRERVLLLGGEVSTGPGSSGGYEVHVELPLEEARA
jgi:signal transduction histidine kinase